MKLRTKRVTDLRQSGEFPIGTLVRLRSNRLPMKVVSGTFGGRCSCEWVSRLTGSPLRKKFWVENLVRVEACERFEE